MIKVNLLGKNEGFQMPVILGMDLGLISLPGMFLVLVVYYCSNTILLSSWNEELNLQKQKVINARKELRKIEKDIRKNAGIKAQLDEFKKQLAHLKSRRIQVDEIFKIRTNPYKVLERLARNIPDDLWFTNVEVKPDRKIVISGAAVSHRSIGNLINQANEASYFGKSLYIKDVQTIEQGKDGNIERVEKFVIEGNIESFDPWGN